MSGRSRDLYAPRDLRFDEETVSRGAVSCRGVTLARRTVDPELIRERNRLSDVLRRAIEAVENAAPWD